MSGPSDRELSNLSEAEREALAGHEDEAGSDPNAEGGEDGDQAQGKDAGAKAGEEGADKGAAADEGGDGNADGAGAAAGAAAAGNGAAAAGSTAAAADAAAAGAGDAGKPGGDGDAAAAGADEVVPQLRVARINPTREIPADLDDQLKKVDNDIAALEQKLDDGDIQTKEFTKELRKLTDQRQDLRDIRAEAANVDRSNVAARNAAWDSAQDAFYGANPEFKDSPIMEGALDAALRGLYKNDKYRTADFLWLLNKAASQVRETIGPKAAAAAPAAGNGKPADPPRTPAATRQAAQAARAVADRARVPVTTGGLPQAGADAPANDEFSHLDNLAGMELERALARMTPDQQAKYLSM